MKDMNEYLRWFILGGLFIVPFLVFIVVNDMFFPYITGKNFAFRVIVELIFGAWIVLAYVDKQYRPQLSFITAAIALFTVVMGAAAVFGVNFDKSFWSNYERMDGYITILHLFGYFLVAGSVMKSHKLWDYLWYVSIGVSVILGLKGIAAVLGGEAGRISTTLGNPIYLAVYMLFHVFLSVYFIFRDRIEQWSMVHIALIGAAGIQITNILLTQTRGTILGLFGGIVLTGLIIAIFEKERTAIKKVAIGGIGLVVVLVGMFFTFKDTQFVQEVPVLNRFAKISMESGSVESRFIIWDMSMQGFLEEPALGWGQGNFPYVFSKYYDPQMFNKEPWYDRAHNVFLDWLIAGGVVGLLSYLSIFVAALYLIWIKNKDDFSLVSKAVFTGLLGAYFVHNIFVFDNLISYIMFFTFLAFLHAKNFDVHHSFFDRIKEWFASLMHRDTNQAHALTVGALMLVVTLSVVYFTNYPAYAQNKLIIEAISTPNEQAVQSLQTFKEALSYDTFGNAETRERLLFKAQQVYRTQDVAAEVRQEYLNFAQQEAQKQIEAMPGESKYPLFASGLYSAEGDYDNAIAMLERALDISPKKDLVLLALGDIYINKREPQKAIEYYQETLDNSNGENKEAALRVAHAAILMGDEEKAEAVMTPLYGTHRVPEQLIIQAYQNTGQFDVIADIFQTAIEEDPSDPGNYFQLSGVYYQMEEIEQAVATLQEVIEAFPNDESVLNDASQYIQRMQEGSL